MTPEVAEHFHSGMTYTHHWRIFREFNVEYFFFAAQNIQISTENGIQVKYYWNVRWLILLKHRHV